MPLEPPDSKHLAAAEGFLTLGMLEEANAELEEIDPFCRRLPEVLAVRAGVYTKAERWELLQVVTKQLAAHEPRNAEWPILLAYATRRTDSLEAARAILLAAAEAHPSHAIIRYNLACYECQLGNISAAKEHLSEAFSLKPSCRETALTDPDLQPLLDGMGSF